MIYKIEKYLIYMQLVSLKRKKLKNEKLNIIKSYFVKDYITFCRLILPNTVILVSNIGSTLSFEVNF